MDKDVSELSAQEWRERLSDEQFYVCREKGTERAFSGRYHDCKDKGIYRCACCGEPLFNSETKFDSGTGWPSFWQALDEAAIESDVDVSHGMRREEVHCPKCGCHIGHVLPDGPQPPRLSHCINSVALMFEKETISNG